MRGRTTAQQPRRAYRGPDRRAVPAGAVVTPGRPLVWAVAGSGTACALAAGAHLLPGAGPGDPVAVAALAWSGPVVLAGTLLLCAWRVGGRAAAAHGGVAALLAGGAGPGVAALVSGPTVPGGRVLAAAAALAVAGAGAGAHLVAAARGAQVRTDVRPGRATAHGALLVLAAGAATAALAPSVRLAAAAGGGGATVLLALAAGAGSAALGAAVDVLRWSFGVQHVRGLSAMASLQRYEAELAEDRLRRHDARSALAAVRAASAVLSGPVPERPELATAVREELSRVERLLAPPPAPAAAGAAGGAGPVPAPRRPSALLDAVVDLRDPRAPRPAGPAPTDVHAALAPVLAAWRAQGLDVQAPPPPPADSPAVVVTAEVDAVRRIVGNLLDNAARHAPGARVRLDVEAAGTDGDVVLVVRDDGPGVPPRWREAVFVPGARPGARAPGTGLGLASARGLAEARGGSLRLVGSSTGACFELRLPAAPPAPATAGAA